MGWPAGRMISRDIGCANIPPGRGKQICDALSGSMEWTWMGHAIISPGWRVRWKGIRRVYCQEQISASDLAVITAMKTSRDWRLQDGADDLIRLIGSITGTVTEPESSIFNPKNDQYILKDGCLGYR